MTTTRIIQRTIALDQGGLLAQSRPATVNAETFYSPGEAIQTELDEFVIANVSDSVVEFQLYHDKTGGLTTAAKCIWTDSLEARKSVRLQRTAYMTASVETLSIQASIADTLTFTLYGRETQERAR